MIPYISIPALELIGPLKIQPFGALVFSALLVGYYVALWQARQRNLSEERAGDLVIWTAVGGFVVAHLVSVIFYFPERIAQNPLELLKIWTSLSSYGGFAGGALGAVLYIRKERLPFWEHIDLLAVALTVGWFFGRMGCTVAHDHPGKLTDFVFAVQYPGGTRHDLGLYEWIFTVGLNVAVFTLLRFRPKPGTILAVLMIAYAPVRFSFDFLRTADKHYLGLTPGQYFSIALLVAGCLLAWRVWKRPPEADTSQVKPAKRGGRKR